MRFHITPVIRILAVLAFSAAAIHASGNEGWGSVASAILAFVVYLGFEASEFRHKESSKHDQELFQEFCAKNSTRHGWPMLIYNQDFAASFPTQDLRDMGRFLNEWGRPEFTFQDRKVEKAKRRLYRKIEKLKETLDAYSYRSRTHAEEHTIDFEKDVPGHDKVEQRDTLNRLAHEAAEAHEKFIKQGKTLLS